MATQKVIVKRLASIENFGSMNVFCSDKTDIDEGTIKVESVLDFNGNPNEKARLYAYLNASYQTGFTNPIDDAICVNNVDISGYQKLDECHMTLFGSDLAFWCPKRIRFIITKGALQNILDACSSVETSEARLIQ